MRILKRDRGRLVGNFHVQFLPSNYIATKVMVNNCYAWCRLLSLHQLMSQRPSLQFPVVPKVWKDRPTRRILGLSHPVTQKLWPMVPPLSPNPLSQDSHSRAPVQNFTSRTQDSSMHPFLTWPPGRHAILCKTVLSGPTLKRDASKKADMWMAQRNRASLRHCTTKCKEIIICCRLHCTYTSIEPGRVSGHVNKNTGP